MGPQYGCPQRQLSASWTSKSVTVMLRLCISKSIACTLCVRLVQAVFASSRSCAVSMCFSKLLASLSCFLSSGLDLQTNPGVEHKPLSHHLPFHPTLTPPYTAYLYLLYSVQYLRITKTPPLHNKPYSRATAHLHFKPPTMHPLGVVSLHLYVPLYI